MTTTDLPPPAPAVDAAGDGAAAGTRPHPFRRGTGSRGTKGEQHRGKRGRRRQPPAPAAVNLLSPWVLDEIRVRRLRFRFAVGAMALVLAAAAGWGVLRMQLATAEQGLEADVALNDGLNRQIGQLGEVRGYAANVARRESVVFDNMRYQVALSDVVAALEEALPPGARLDTVSLTLRATPSTDPAAQAAAAPACPGPDPFGIREVVGCAQLTGVATSRADVGELVQSLSDGLFIEPFVTATTATEVEGGPSGIAFTGSVGLRPAVLSGRYDDLDPAAPATEEPTGVGDRRDRVAAEEGRG